MIDVESYPILLGTGLRQRLVGATATLLAAGACVPPVADAVSTSFEFQGVHEQVQQKLSLNTQSGNAACEAQMQSDDTTYNSLSLVMRVESYRRGEWRSESDFSQPASISRSPGGTHHISSTDKTRYSLRRLSKLAHEKPVRLACYSGESIITLRLPAKVFN